MVVEVLKTDPPVVRAGGEITFPDVPAFQNALEAAAGLSDRGFILDLSEVPYIDEHGRAVVLGACKRASLRRECLAIIIPAGNVREITARLHLEQIPCISVCENLATARELFAAEGGRSR